MADLITQSGVAHGSVAARLLNSNMDPGSLRPFISSEDGRAYVTLNAYSPEHARNMPTQNALLLDKEWQFLDKAIMQAAKPRVALWNELRSMATPQTIANGMNFSVITHQRTGTVGRASVSMDGIVRNRQERRTFDMGGVPLPIISKEFSLTAREIAVSRQMGTNLDTTGAIDAAQSCAEELERIVLGTADSFSYAGYSIYGYTTFPNRLTGTMMIPTNVAWTPDQARNDILAIMQALNNAYHYGPYRIYYSYPWMKYMLQRYSAYEGKSLIQILKELPNVSGITQADYLGGYRILVVEENPTVAQAVIGMEFQTIQWEEAGGLEQMFKVMGILVPRLRADKNGNTGIADYVGT